MSARYLFTLVLNLLVVTGVYAADVPFDFENQADAQRYHKLVEEIRCLVCQNQSLSDSHADLAQDLRDEIYQMVLAGHANAEIIDFMTDRYGDFVLYRPPLKATTFLLWFGPPFIFLVAILVVMRIVRQRPAESLDPISGDNHKPP